MSYNWYRRPQTYDLDGDATQGTEQQISSPLIAYNTDSYLRNISPSYSIPSGPGNARWLSEIKSVDSIGNDIETVYTRELRVTKYGSGGTTTREKWDNRWDGGAWVPQLDFQIPSEGSETSVINVNNYIWLGTPPLPGTYRSHQSYYVNGVKQGSTVEEGTFEVRGIVFANVRAKCPFDPEEASGTLLADIYALPSPNESYLSSGWSPSGSVTWEFPNLDNVSGTTSVGTLQSDGKIADLSSPWNGKDSTGESNLALNQLTPRAIANTSGGGNAFTQGLGFAFLFHRDCPCDKKSGEVCFVSPIPVGGSFKTICMKYQSHNSCRGPSSFGHGWSSIGSAHLTELFSGDLIYRDENSRVMKWTEDNGIYTAVRPDNYTLVESLGNPGPPYRLTFRDQITREFDSTGKLTKDKDRNGNTTTYTYNTSGYLETVSDGRGGLLTYDYGTRVDGQPISIRSGDPQTGRLVQFGYSGGRLISITNPAGEVTQFEYNAQGKLSKQTEVRPTLGDRVVEHTYDKLSGRKFHSDYYGLWRETYLAWPWYEYTYFNASETVVGPIPEEEGAPVIGRGIHYFWDEQGRTLGVERNRIGLFF